MFRSAQTCLAPTGICTSMLREAGICCSPCLSSRDDSGLQFSAQAGCSVRYPFSKQDVTTPINIQGDQGSNKEYFVSGGHGGDVDR